MSIAILTGASAGLGQSFFRSLVARHPDLTGIWLIARRRERLEQMAEGCPIPVTVLSMDLTDPACYAQLGDKLKADGVRQYMFDYAGSSCSTRRCVQFEKSTKRLSTSMRSAYSV